MLTAEEKLNHFKRFEGNIPFFYLDGVSVVTIGIGCSISWAEASTLTFYNREDKSFLTQKQVEDDYRTVEKCERGHLVNYYEPLTLGRLDQVAIDRMFLMRLAYFEVRLRTFFPNFANYSEKVQLALTDMIYNLGEYGLKNKFPTFCKLITEGNFAGAARESERIQVSDSRNIFIQELLTST